MSFLKRIIVSFIVVFVSWGPAWSAGDDFTVMETLETGTINWSLRTVRATGSGTPLEKANPADLDKQERLVEEAMAKAREKMMETISMLPLNTEHIASDLVAEHADIINQIRSMVNQAKIITKDYLTDGSVKMLIELPFDGGFAQLMLPEEIQQIQPLKTIVVRPPDQVQSQEEAPVTYTGLIVDTRGLIVRPVLSPKVLDERGQEVYGPAYISREYAVSYGTVLYTRNIKDPAVAQRVGGHPLTVTGLKSQGAFQADIVISTADASKLHANSSYLKLLNQCRVAIILNGKHD